MMSAGRILVVLAASVALIQSRPLSAVTERTAPDIRFLGADGAETALSASRGRVVLVDIWASWCAPCRAAFPVLDQLYRDYHERGLDVFAVNVDEHKKDAARFLAGRSYLMPVFFDPQGRTPSAFSVQAMPTSFLIDRRGAIRYEHDGYSDQVLRSYKSEIDQLLRETP